MSSIPTKQIDGDVAVGRNVTAGGDANIQGNVRVGHDLKVEGWLEAKNIKGANKGLFASAAALREAYPRPHDGWFAGVSATEADISDLELTVEEGKALFRMYVGSGGDWVCEPIDKLYEIVVDNEQIGNLQEDLTALQGAHETLEGRVDAQDTEISGIKTQQTTLGNNINSNTSSINTLTESVSTLSATVAENAESISENAEAITGLATQIGNVETAAEAAAEAAEAAAEAAGEAAAAAQETADGAVPKTIELSELDTMGTDGSVQAMKSFARNEVHTRYKVVVSTEHFARGVGVLDVFGDHMDHVVTQVFTTHIVPDSDGKLSGSVHACQELHKYTRSFNINSPQLENEEGTWTAWRDLDAAEAELQELLDSTIDDVQNVTTRVEQVAQEVGILEFLGYVSTANDVMTVEVEGVYFATGDKKFVVPGTTGPVYPSEYNVFDRIGTCLQPKLNRIYRLDSTLFRYDSEEGKLAEIGGGSATGNVINIHEISKDWAATNRGAAAGKVPAALRTGGRKITFMYAAGKWQTWQFTGTLVSDWELEQYWRQEVRSVSLNGAEASAPDLEGNIDLTFSVDVDQSLNKESDNPVSNKAVVAAIADVESTISKKHTFDPATRMLHFYDGDDNIIESVNIPGGGSGGDTNPTAIEITIESALNVTVREGADYTIEYQWRHYNINSDQDTQYGGTAELIVGGAVVDRKIVIQGYQTFSVGPWLQLGLNTVRVRITSDDGVISQSANIKITAAALSLRSLYDISTANIIGSPFQIRYVVNGSGEKKVAFTVDEEDAGTETVLTSGATSIKTIATTGMEHSIHTVAMKASRDIGADKPLETDTISFDVMVVDRESNEPLIALSRPATASQYSTIEIPFAVYDPENAQGAIVEIYLGTELIEKQRVDRSLHTFSHRVKQHGDMTFTFKVQNSQLTTENSVTVNVLAAAQQIEMETDGLSLYLSASGRSNDAENRDEWSFTSESGVETSAEFTNCNFDAQSGWMKDKNGITALHLEKGAKCTIPFYPFATDAKTAGKTLEIEFMVSDCFNMEASIISCISGNVGFDIKAQEFLISSALRQTLTGQFKQDERIRIGFTIEQVTGTNRFMHLFMNGKHSGTVQYDTNDYFVQNPAAGITMGDASCKLDIYNILVYETALSFRQMQDNSIANLDDTAQMFKELEDNDIYNEESSGYDLSYDKCVQKYPCIRYIGELPKFKGDKKTGTLVYEDPGHPEDNFSNPTQIDVQGTSSQYYTVKNWKVKAKGMFQMLNRGTEEKRFALRAYDINGKEVPQKPVKTFCLKADFAESSGTHNTGAANMIDEILKAAGIVTPMQTIDNTVRTTIYGFPCLMFHQETETSPVRFVGRYNFNNDKSTHETFGFQDIEGFNDGMINRDDYLVWEGPLSTLQGNADALAAALDEDIPYYLIENGTSDSMTNHLVEYDETAGAWVDKGEMWRWDASLRAWTKRDGSTCTRADGVMDKVAAGEFVENDVECWEFLNNGHPMCLLHTSDYTTQVHTGMGDWVKEAWMKSDEDGKYAPYWTGAFEPRYPDNDDLNRQYTRGKIPEQLKRVTDWLASLAIIGIELTDEEKAAKSALFAGKIDNYFNKKMALAYDLIRQGFVAADQGAKNMMWAIIDGIVYIIFYDNDTIWLINNEGRIMFTPYVEPHSKDRLGKFVFNGESSTLWNHIERSLIADERALYNDMVAAGFTYNRALFWFNTRQCDRLPKAVHNADSKFKYIDSFGKASEDGSGAVNNYLDMAQGTREEHRKWAMYERFQYQNAKWGAGTFRESRIYLRVNTAGESSVPAKVEVTITAAQDWYFAFRFAANAGWDPVRVLAGETATFSAPEGSNPNDTETYIHQADRLSDIGDISVLYPTTCDIAQGRMLTRLVVGNKTPGYIGKLATLTFGSHPLMTYINVCNIPTLASSLDLTGCSAIEEIEAQGSAITGLNLPAGSGVQKIHLPETVVRLEFDRFPNLTNDNLIVDGYANIQSVNITDCVHLNPMKILEAITDTSDNSLRYIRVTGGILRGTGEELISLINLGVHGDENKNGKPEILGTYYMTKIPESNELDIIVDGINPDGFSVVLVVEAYVNVIDEVNGESYSGEAEVETVTLENIGDHLEYYNGETAAEYTERVAASNESIHDIITQ